METIMNFEEFRKMVVSRVYDMRYPHMSDEKVDQIIEAHSDMISDEFTDDPTEDGADWVAREIVAYFM
jgi:hypothetical protein